MIHESMKEAFPPKLFESVENIVVGALADQDRFARHSPAWRRMSLMEVTEPDSRVVTRDIVAAIVTELGITEEMVQGEPGCETITDDFDKQCNIASALATLLEVAGK